MTAVDRSGSALASLPLPFLPLCLPVLQKYPDPRLSDSVCYCGEAKETSP